MSTPRPRGRPVLGLIKRSISFPPDLLARIDAARGEEERSAFVVALVQEALDQRARVSAIEPEGAGRVAAFVHQRTTALLERPDGWGPPAAVELQLLLLLEMGHVAAGAPPEVVDGTMDRYRRYMGRSVGESSLSLAGRLGLTTRSNERFVALLRGFVAEEQLLQGA